MCADKAGAAGNEYFFQVNALFFKAQS
jgi:hypothetical protein